MSPPTWSFGAHPMPGGGTRFRLWAPAAKRVDLLLLPAGDATGSAPRRLPMSLVPFDAAKSESETIYECSSSESLAGSHYAFLIDGKTRVPDPASRSSPSGVHDECVVVDPDAYAWQDAAWAGIAWHRVVIYELHVGTFSKGGTFRAAIAHLDRLKALGITAIEVMPVAAFAGERNWGYDGVLHYAPDASYGSPDDFKALVDAAHARGLAVLLDVVYNHFGPDGNYIGAYAPGFFTDRIETPWGAAIDFDSAAGSVVRRFYVENALYWIDEFHLDGLRLDAVHAIHDDSQLHVVAELAQALHERMRVRAAAGRTPREAHLILENEDNRAWLLERHPDGTPAIATAQWNDDIHHALHVLTTGEVDGYYADFAEAPARRLADGLANGFIYRGQPSAHAGGKPRGEPSEALPSLAFINFLQNHDQIGNRAFGERIGMLAPVAAVRTAAACVLLGPAVPMIFMGDEFASSSPFQYFCDFSGPLADAVRNGRRKEFARFARFADPAVRERIPDPCAEATFAASRLDWSEADVGAHAEMFAFYRACLEARRRHVEPLLASLESHPSSCTARFEMLGDRAFLVSWRFGAGSLHLAANFDASTSVELPEVDGSIVFRIDGEPSATPRDATPRDATPRDATRRDAAPKLGPHQVILLR